MGKVYHGRVARVDIFGACERGRRQGVVHAGSGELLPRVLLGFPGQGGARKPGAILGNPPGSKAEALAKKLPDNQVVGEIGERHDQFRDDADIKQDQKDDEAEPFKFVEEPRTFRG